MTPVEFSAPHSKGAKTNNLRATDFKRVHDRIFSNVLHK